MDDTEILTVTCPPIPQCNNNFGTSEEIIRRCCSPLSLSGKKDNRIASAAIARDELRRLSAAVDQLHYTKMVHSPDRPTEPRSQSLSMGRIAAASRAVKRQR